MPEVLWRGFLSKAHLVPAVGERNLCTYPALAQAQSQLRSHSGRLVLGRAVGHEEQVHLSMYSLGPSEGKNKYNPQTTAPHHVHDHNNRFFSLFLSFTFLSVKKITRLDHNKFFPTL